MKIETKFDIAQEVFIIIDNKIHKVSIDDIDVSITHNQGIDLINIKYTLFKHPILNNRNKIFGEDHLFSTKKDLLDSL